jgi:hypothetical protein
MIYHETAAITTGKNPRKFHTASYSHSSLEQSILAKHDLVTKNQFLAIDAVRVLQSSLTAQSRAVNERVGITVKLNAQGAFNLHKQGGILRSQPQQVAAQGPKMQAFRAQRLKLRKSILYPGE